MPASGVWISTTGSASWVATGAGSNRVMDASVGTSQTTQTGNTAASLASQNGWLGRWVSAPIAAQTIAAAQSVNLSAAWAESNATSDFIPAVSVCVWRPSTGAKVGTIFDNVDTALTTEPGTTQTAIVVSNGGSSSSVTAQDGDILVVEAWRKLNAQTMATAYTNTFFFDGTTEASATSCASFLSFGNAITMLDLPPERYKRTVPNQGVQRAANW